MRDLDHPDDCWTLVNHFYACVRTDPVLAPIFAGRIADWTEHLERMAAFWSTLLFGTAAYRRDVFGAHTTLSLERRHFDRWLELWRASVAALYSGRRAADAVAHAESIRRAFERRLARSA